jgi:UDP-N-acetylglucosamine 2-epimerase (non-hydrolysing)
MKPGGYGVVTLHRPSNVDDVRQCGHVLRVLRQVSRQLPLIFPIHPRTRSAIRQVLHTRNLPARLDQLYFCDPLGYMEFLGLTMEARLVITDSGGLQEETTAYGIPCLTLRDTTERPITVEQGTSTLIGNRLDRLPLWVQRVLGGRYKRGRCPSLWDGHAARRIASRLARWLKD